MPDIDLDLDGVRAQEGGMERAGVGETKWTRQKQKRGYHRGRGDVALVGRGRGALKLAAWFCLCSACVHSRFAGAPCSATCASRCGDREEKASDALPRRGVAARTRVRRHARGACQYGQCYAGACALPSVEMGGPGQTHMVLNWCEGCDLWVPPSSLCAKNASASGDDIFPSRT